jgi:hypothetical protein
MKVVGPGTEAEPGPLWKRLAWFFGIAAAAGTATALVAYGMKALLR